MYFPVLRFSPTPVSCVLKTSWVRPRFGGAERHWARTW